MKTPVVHLLAVICFACAARSVHAADQTTVGVRSTTLGQTAATQQATDRNGLSQNDMMLAQIWGITPEEMQRAITLLKGPRASFSVSNMSPVEALGIHARTPAERRKYADLFVRAFHQDVERALAWQKATDDAMRSMYPNEPVISFYDTAKVDIDPGIAGAAKVPRAALTQRRAATATKEQR